MPSRLTRFIAVVVILLAPRAGEAQGRMIIGTGVVCRARPDSTAPAVHAYRLGEVFGVRRVQSTLDSNWLFDFWHVNKSKPSCWVHDRMTTPFTPEDPKAALMVKQESWADDVAWTAAGLERPADECYSACVLKGLIIDGPQQYWIKLPHGRNVAKALSTATRWAKYAVSVACYDPARPVPEEFQLIDQVRTSLANVGAEGKRELLVYLDQIEATCKKK